MIKFINCFALLTFLISSIFITLIYFAPSHTIVDYGVLYGIVLGVLTAVLLTFILFKNYCSKNNRRRFLVPSLLLILNIVATIIYFIIGNYCLNTILIKINNKTGHDVTCAGLWGCGAQSWGTLQNGESKTIRLPGNISCQFIITYKLNDIVRHEVLPRKEFTKNIYYLGTNPDSEVEN